MFLIGFPLLLVPFAIYNIVAFLMPGLIWSGTMVTVPMKSGAGWALTGGDVLIVFALCLLFVEMAKVARVGRRGIVEHGLSFLLFAGMTAEFVLVTQAASGVFFLLVAMSFFDMLGGFIMRARRMRREPVVEHTEPAPPVVEPAPAVPPVEPAPPPAEPKTEHTPS